MLTLACKIPHSVIAAVSGGSDSMAMLSFLESGRKDITVLHIDHGTVYSKDARKLVETYCKEHKLPLVIREVPDTIKHTENDWREFRLKCYREYTRTGVYLLTAHTFDDNLEWALYSFIHGKAKFMKPVDEEYKLMKPFLYIEKVDLIDWCDKRQVPYIVDPTNIGQDNMRAKMRSQIIPLLLEIHPGMKTSIRNKLKNNEERK